MFYVSDWLVKVEVSAPCATKNLKGLTTQGSLSLRLDEEVKLVAEYTTDADGNSWESICGILRETKLHNAPIFVTFNSKENSICIKPIS